MPPCASYNELCAKGSVVQQCMDQGPIPQMVDSVPSQVRPQQSKLRIDRVWHGVFVSYIERVHGGRSITATDVQQVVVTTCGEMSMPGCDTCTGEGNDCPDTLKSLSTVCLSTRMEECADFYSMCDTSGDGLALFCDPTFTPTVAARWSDRFLMRCVLLCSGALQGPSHGQVLTDRCASLTSSCGAVLFLTTEASTQAYSLPSLQQASSWQLCACCELPGTRVTVWLVVGYAPLLLVRMHHQLSHLFLGQCEFPCHRFLGQWSFSAIRKLCLHLHNCFVRS